MARPFFSLFVKAARISAGVALLSLLLAFTPAEGSAQAPGGTATASTTKAQVSNASKKKIGNKKQKITKEVVETPPPPPPPPPTPEQMPAVAPEVVYSGGLLSINAQNSTMNDVLSAVRRVTGASIEKPPVGGSDRVVAHLGPGQPKDVLQSLFNGSRYDYIILGSMTRPGGVERIILTARSTAPQAAAPVANRQAPPAVQPPATEQEEPEADTEDMSVPDNREEAQPEQPQPAQEQPRQPYPQTNPQQQQQPQPQTQQGQEDQGIQSQPRVKSPEELLRELQQMQKQQSPDQNQQSPDQNQQQQQPQ